MQGGHIVGGFGVVVVAVVMLADVGVGLLWLWVVLGAVAALLVVVVVGWRADLLNRRLLRSLSFLMFISRCWVGDVGVDIGVGVGVGDPGGVDIRGGDVDSGCVAGAGVLRNTYL